MGHGGGSSSLSLAVCEWVGEKPEDLDGVFRKMMENRYDSSSGERAGRTVDKTKPTDDLDTRNAGISVECWECVLAVRDLSASLSSRQKDRNVKSCPSSV